MNWKEGYVEITMGDFKANSLSEALFAERLLKQQIKFIETKIIERLIDEATPEISVARWNKWSVERQLGYSQAISDIKEQLRAKWLGNKN